MSSCAGDDVRVRHHDARRRRPSPSPRRRARTPCRGSCTTLRRRPPARRGRARSPRAAAATSRLGPVDARERVEPRAARSSSGPDGGSTVLSRCRIAERWTLAAQLAGAALHRQRAEDPHHAEPGARDQHRAEQPVERAEAGQRPQPAADLPPERLEQPGEQRPDEQRADQPEGRARTGIAPVRQHERAEPRAEPRARGETRQRQRAGDEPLRPAEEGEQEHEPHDDPVDPRHVRPSVPLRRLRFAVLPPRPDRRERIGADVPERWRCRPSLPSPW